MFYYERIWLKALYDEEHNLIFRPLHVVKIPTCRHIICCVTDYLLQNSYDVIKYILIEEELFWGMKFCWFNYT